MDPTRWNVRNARFGANVAACNSGTLIVAAPGDAGVVVMELDGGIVTHSGVPENLNLTCLGSTGWSVGAAGLRGFSSDAGTTFFGATGALVIAGANSLYVATSNSVSEYSTAGVVQRTKTLPISLAPNSIALLGTAVFVGDSTQGAVAWVDMVTGASGSLTPGISKFGTALAVGTFFPVSGPELAVASASDVRFFKLPTLSSAEVIVRAGVESLATVPRYIDDTVTTLDALLVGVPGINAAGLYVGVQEVDTLTSSDSLASVQFGRRVTVSGTGRSARVVVTDPFYLSFGAVYADTVAFPWAGISGSVIEVCNILSNNCGMFGECVGGVVCLYSAPTGDGGSDGGSGSTDGGSSSDGGADASISYDDGGGLIGDGGTVQTDGGTVQTDGGSVSLDGGLKSDAGVTSDGGLKVDAGSTLDGGKTLDDGGTTQPDGGNPDDGGIRDDDAGFWLPDGGFVPYELNASGCNCQSALDLWPLLAMLVLRRARRR